MTNITEIKTMPAAFRKPSWLLSALLLSVSLVFVAGVSADSMMKDSAMKKGESIKPGYRY